MPGPETDRVAIVTGGATGLGAAVSCRLAGRGFRVAVNYSKSADDAERTASECRLLGVDAVPVQGDVSLDEDCRRVVEEVVDRWGRVDVLINNAGRTKFVEPQDLAGLDMDDFCSIYGTNVVGAFQMVRAVVPHMRSRGFGAVVNVSSTSALDGAGTSIAYAASKGALNTMSLSLARALGPEIRVNVICPGFMATRWFADPLGEQGFLEKVADVERSSPLGRAGTPDDIATAVVFLADEGAEHMTGTMMLSDGGAQLGRRSFPIPADV
jgi:3-oxoacyl-[acyl-carrier protein] reductase